MGAQGVSLTLSALGKLEPAAGAVSLEGWEGLARATERTAPTMSTQDVRSTLAAYANLSTGAKKLLPLARARLEAVAERLAPEMTREELKTTLWGCRKLGLTIPSALRK